MKVGVAMDGDRVSEHFGHCESYAVYEIEGGEITGKEVLMSPGHEPGMLPRFLSEHGVQIVIAGGMGPKAVDLFNSFGINVILGVSGMADDAAAAFAAGGLDSGESMCDHKYEGECNSH